MVEGKRIAVMTTADVDEADAVTILIIQGHVLTDGTDSIASHRVVSTCNIIL